MLRCLNFLSVIFCLQVVCTFCITESYDKKHNKPCAYLAFEANVRVLIVQNVFLLEICNFLIQKHFHIFCYRYDVIEYQVSKLLYLYRLVSVLDFWVRAFVVEKSGVQALLSKLNLGNLCKKKSIKRKKKYLNRKFYMNYSTVKPDIGNFLL